MKIYKNGEKYYKKIDIGTERFKNMFKWQEVRPFLWFFISTKNIFWLDDYGFELIR